MGRSLEPALDPDLRAGPRKLVWRRYPVAEPTQAYRRLQFWNDSLSLSGHQDEINELAEISVSSVCPNGSIAER